MSSESVRRVFFAWVPDTQFKQTLGEELAALHARDEPRLRWLPPSNWHVTLRFIGDVAGETVDTLAQQLPTAVQHHAQFAMRFEAIELFPSERRPLVLAATAAASPAGLDLVAALEGLCRVLRLPAERRPWRPHMTLARVRGQKALTYPSVAVAAGFNVTEVVLMESLPTRQGRVYVPLCSAALAG